MRVGIITPRYPPTVQGGGERSVQLLAEELRLRDDIESVTVFSFDGNRVERDSELTIYRLKDCFHSVPEVANAQAALSLCDHFDEVRKCDILHGYNLTLYPLLGYISEHLDIPSVATLNSYNVLPKHAFGMSPEFPRRVYELVAMPTTGSLLRRYMRKIDILITLSEATKRIYRANGFYDCDFEVIPNILDPSFEPLSHNPDDDAFYLLYVGSLIEEKGVSTLVEATQYLPKECRVRIIGDGPQLDDLQSLATDYNVSDQIEFLGQIEHSAIKKYYSRSHVFVHPAVWPEPFSRTLLEAMQSGLPVIVSTAGGSPEVIKDRSLQFTPGDPVELAGTIEQVYRSKDTAQIGAANQLLVADRYHPSVVLEQLTTLYGKLINRE